MNIANENLNSLLLLMSVAAPLFGFVVLTLRALLFDSAPERFIAVVARCSFLISIFSLMGLSIVMTWGEGSYPPKIALNWFALAEQNYQISFALDNFSLSFLALVAILAGLSSVFSETYLHKESGYQRFYIVLLLATFGMNLVVAADSLSLIVVGWEFLGISSTLLIAFFYTRKGPLVNATRAFIAYRCADVGFLLALLYAHHSFNDANISQILANFAEPAKLNGDPASIALIFGGLLFFAAAGKSSILPFFPWLPRAMEGPTPSSALFYGAFATHAGAILLLRLSPVVSASTTLSLILISFGFLSALFSTFVGRTRPDIKSSLAYASLTQVALIYIEIGLGWFTLASIHIAGHMSLRTYQFMRAPSALHDLHVREVLGVEVRERAPFYDRILSSNFQSWLYRLAFEEGGIATFYERLMVRPFIKWAAWFSRLEQSSERGLEKSLARGLHRLTFKSTAEQEAL